MRPEAKALVMVGDELDDFDLFSKNVAGVIEHCSIFDFVSDFKMQSQPEDRWTDDEEIPDEQSIREILNSPG